MCSKYIYCKKLCKIAAREQINLGLTNQSNVHKM